MLFEQLAGVLAESLVQSVELAFAGVIDPQFVATGVLRGVGGECGNGDCDVARKYACAECACGEPCGIGFWDSDFGGYRGDADAYCHEFECDGADFYVCAGQHFADASLHGC